MTILAGIVARSAEPRLSSELRDALDVLVSRYPGEAIFRLERPGCHLVKADIGAYRGAGHLSVDSDSIAILSGEPLLEANRSSRRDRDDDLRALGPELADAPDLPALRSARGSFSCAHYSAHQRRLTLVADKLALRPIYYWIGDEWVVFASALRILEAFALVPKEMDLLGVTETHSLGYPLDDRTPYSQIRMLRAGEILRVDSGAEARELYWRWDAIPPAESSLDDLLDDAYDRFERAVADRLGDDRVVNAFLTGGLDSRCVVAQLRKRGVEAHTVCFAPARTQDQGFSQLLAKALGTHHRFAPIDPVAEGRLAVFRTSQLHWLASADSSSLRPERPLLGWGGNGGSVGLGHVYLTPAMVEALEGGREAEAVDLYLGGFKAAIPRRLFRAGLGDRLLELRREAILEELRRIQHADRVRAFHIFLLLSDQRHHYRLFFEDIDLTRLELRDPFFDSAFLELIVSIPISECLYHRFYVDWLSRFPEPVTQVPWQVYPGHAACPLPVPADLEDQWEHAGGATRIASRRAKTLASVRPALRSGGSWRSLVDVNGLRAAFWAHRLGLRDCSAILDAASAYHGYWATAGGRLTELDRSPYA